MLTAIATEFLADSHETEQQLLVSSAAAGLSGAGLLVQAPLQIAALPLLVWLGVHPAQRAWQAWRQERRVTLELAETAALAFCIVQGSYLVGSLAFSAYYLGKLLVEKRHDTAPHPAAEPSFLWARLLCQGCEVATLVAELHAGDVIVVASGEMVPVAGVVTAGTAWVKANHAPTTSTQDEQRGATLVTCGEHVEPASIIQVGCIHIVVTPTAPAD